MKLKISIATTSRADYDQLFWLIRKIKLSKRHTLDLIVSGSHLMKKYGNTVKKIKSDKLNFKKINLEIKNDKQKDILSALSKGINKFANYLNLSKPHYLILLGDRYEILSTAIAASFLNIPIIHLNGGELTLGAHDDWIRHCITKMSNIHFVANEVYKKRVIQLGEEPRNVYNTGGLSSDNVLKTKLIKKLEIERKLKIKFREKNILITYHPENFSKKNTEKSFDDLIHITRHYKNVGFYFTFPNLDAGNKVIIKKIKKICLKQKNCKYFFSLGRIKYLSLLKNCDLILGNSSSGLLEAPYLGTYTLNIGDRQEGRLRANTVFDCVKDIKTIKKKIDIIFKLIENGKKKKKTNLKKYYGDGQSAEKMFRIINSLKIKYNKKKFFHDI